MTNRFDSHQLPIDKPLTRVGNPPGGGESPIRLGKTVVRYPIALRQNATPGGNFLKPA
jgi:hypothetical protein